MALAARSGRLPVGAGGGAAQLAALLDRLIVMRQELNDGRVPEATSHRLAKAISWVFGDSWDQHSPYGTYIGELMFIYEHRMPPPKGPLPVTPPESVRTIIEERMSELKRISEVLPDSRISHEQAKYGNDVGDLDDFPDLLALAQSLTADALIAAIDEAIPRCHSAWTRARQGIFPSGAGGGAAQIALFLDRLIEMREQILCGTVPSSWSARTAASPSATLGRDWDPESPFGCYIGGLFFLFEHHFIACERPRQHVSPPGMDALIAEWNRRRRSSGTPP